MQLIHPPLNNNAKGAVKLELFAQNIKALIIIPSTTILYLTVDYGRELVNKILNYVLDVKLSQFFCF